MNYNELVKGKYYKRINPETGAYDYLRYEGMGTPCPTWGNMFQFTLLSQICPVVERCPSYYTPEYPGWDNITPIGDPVKPEVKPELTCGELQPGIVYELVKPTYSTHCYINGDQVMYFVNGKWCKTALSIRGFYEYHHRFKEADIYPSLPWE